MGLILRSIVTCLFFAYAIGVEFKYPVNNTCIMAEVDVSFTLSYMKEKRNLSEPQVDTEKSRCTDNGTDSILALKWKDSNDTMTFTFMLNSRIVEVSVEYALIPSQHFKDSKDSSTTILKSPSPLELSLRNMSYKCDSSQDIILKEKAYQLVMSVAKLQVQAFGVENGTFSDFKECSADTSTTENPTPKTTTEHSPQTTVNPPMEYEYQYPEGDSACILLNSAIQLHINYMDKNNATVTAKLNIPSKFEIVKVTGHCADNDTGNAFIMLNWKFKHSPFSLKMDFIADEEAKLKKMEVTGVMSQEDFPGLPDKSKNVTSSGSVVSFVSSKFGYYKCNSTQEVKLDNITVVVIDKIEVQAFGVKNASFTGNGTECSQDLPTATMPTDTTSGTKHTNGTMTTEVGTTATTAPISTTINPNPTNTYSVHIGNVTCVYFVARMDFTFPYTTKNGTNTTAQISVPQKFKTDGTCSTQNETINELNIHFFNYTWTLAFVFGPDNSSSQLGDMQFKTYSVKSITLDYKMDPVLFPGYKENDTKTYNAAANFTGSLFQSKVNGSYKCDVDSEVLFTGNIKLETHHLQYKAFNQDNSTSFGGDLSECSGDNNNNNKTNSVVPIAVGAALAGLVVIVLIAYLIGRRRNRKGYESV